MAVMTRMVPSSAALILSSPPYGIGKTYEKALSVKDYLSGQRRVLAECHRILAPGGWLCWQVGNHVDKGAVTPLDLVLIPEIVDLGFSFRRRVIWTFGHGLHCKKRFSGRHETVLCFSVGAAIEPNYVAEADGDVWDIPNVKNNHPEKTAHPCSFPVELAERLVLSYSVPGATVFDPYMGVGSTLIAAARHNRIASGCDLDAEYVGIALKRLDQLALGTLRTRRMGTPIFQPRPQVGCRVSVDDESQFGLEL
jgi:adenine-specific DNA-methyltransferase